MSLVKSKKVIEFFEDKNSEVKVKIECKCKGLSACEKHCRLNCDNDSFHKINYDY